MKQPSLPGLSSPSANAITALLLIEIPKRWPEARVWRNSVGVAVGMETVKKAIGMMAYDAQGAARLLTSRPLRFGLVGSTDIEGILGPHGTFIAIEVKAGTDKIRPEQAAFGAMIQRAGGIYIIAHSVEQAMADLEVALR